MTTERMTQLWDELKQLPPDVAMNFSLCLANLAMAELGTSAVDAGIFDQVRGADVYIVAATGDLEPKLREAVRQTVAGSNGTTRTIKKGDRPTPMAGRG